METDSAESVVAGSARAVVGSVHPASLVVVGSEAAHQAGWEAADSEHPAGSEVVDLVAAHLVGSAVAGLARPAGLVAVGSAHQAHPVGSAVEMRDVSEPAAGIVQSGFSAKTCLPASRACRMRGACEGVGVETITQSTAGSARAFLRSSVDLAPWVSLGRPPGQTSTSHLTLVCWLAPSTPRWMLPARPMPQIANPSARSAVRDCAPSASSTLGLLVMEGGASAVPTPSPS